MNKCINGNNCPYLGGESIYKIIRERDALRGKVKEQTHLIELATEEINKLKEENKTLKAERDLATQRLKEELQKIFKPNKKHGDKKKSGAPVGHRGKGRKRPEQIDEYISVYPEKCPFCGNEEINIYQHMYKEHVVEDIEIRKITKLFRYHYGYCSNCKKKFYVKDIPGVRANSRIGPTAQAIGGYLRYNGVPYRKVRDFFNDIADLPITHSSLLRFDNKMGENGKEIYEAIKEAIRNSPYVCVDETGWRNDGQNRWLWNFVGMGEVLYHIDPSRSSDVVIKILGEEYGGVLSSDFLSAYNKIKAIAKQKCNGHLLEDIKRVGERNKFDVGSADAVFCDGLKELLKKGIEIWDEVKKGKRKAEELSDFKDKLVPRIVNLLLLPVKSKDVERLRKRIIKHNEELFVYLDNPMIEPTNNKVERILRLPVLMRKIIFGHRSEKGANNFSIIMSIIETGKLRGVGAFTIFKNLVRGDIKLPMIRGP